MLSKHFKLRLFVSTIGVFMSFMATHDLMQYSRNHQAQFANYQKLIAIYEHQLQCQSQPCEHAKSSQNEIKLLKDKIASKHSPQNYWSTSDSLNTSIFTLIIGLMLVLYPYTIKSKHQEKNDEQ